MRTLMILIMFLPTSTSTSTFTKRFNGRGNPFKLKEIMVKASIFPRMTYADSIINLSPVNKNSISWRQKNPGNLRSFKTGKYREFKTVESGYKALIRQLNLYVTGKSIHTDSTTTLVEYVHIYASEAKTKKWYIQVMTDGLNCPDSTKITSLNVDSLAKYHIKMEDVKLFNLMYLKNIRDGESY